MTSLRRIMSWNRHRARWACVGLIVCVLLLQACASKPRPSQSKLPQEQNLKERMLTEGVGLIVEACMVGDQVGEYDVVAQKESEALAHEILLRASRWLSARNVTVHYQMIPMHCANPVWNQAPLQFATSLNADATPGAWPFSLDTHQIKDEKTQVALRDYLTYLSYSACTTEKQCLQGVESLKPANFDRSQSARLIGLLDKTPKIFIRAQGTRASAGKKVAAGIAGGVVSVALMSSSGGQQLFASDPYDWFQVAVVTDDLETIQWGQILVRKAGQPGYTPQWNMAFLSGLWRNQK